MTNLEQMAKRMFEDYLKKVDSKGNWDYLNKERKISWMKEILWVVEFYVKELNKNVKFNIPQTNPRDGSYSRGFNDGIRAERVKFIEQTTKILGDLNQDLEDFINAK